MKLKFVVLVALGVFALAGVAKAAGLFDHHPASSRALLERARTLTPDATLSRVHVRRGPRGIRGPQGAQGAKGAQGAPGPAGSFASIYYASSPTETLCNSEELCSVGSATAECPAGMKVIGGGWGGLGINGTVSYNAKSEGNGWTVVAINWSEAAVTNFRTLAVCVS